MSVETIEAPDLPEVPEEVIEDHDIDLELEVGDHENAIFDTSYRCDKGECGAQAYIRATLKNDGELFFCNHHGREVREALHPQCKEWYSEANRLIEDRKKGSEN